MAKKLRALLVIIPVGILVYLVSLASISTAEVGSAATEEDSADVTVSIEACVVSVEAEALGESGGRSGFQALGSISVEQLLARVGDEGAEVVSGAKVLVGSESLAELSAEHDTREKTKVAEEGSSEDGESVVLLNAQAHVRPGGKIAVQFTFKQIVSENSSVQAGEEEHEEEGSEVFELSSKVTLQPGRPRVVGARRIHDQAMFLILHADI